VQRGRAGSVSCALIRHGARCGEPRGAGGQGWHRREWVRPTTTPAEYIFSAKPPTFHCSPPSDPTSCVSHATKPQTTANRAIIDYTSPAVQRWVVENDILPALRAGYDGIDFDDDPSLNAFQPRGTSLEDGGFHSTRVQHPIPPGQTLRPRP
jgi:hypothetical protein